MSAAIWVDPQAIATRLDKENRRLRITLQARDAEVTRLVDALREVGNSAGFQYMRYEFRDRIDALLREYDKEKQDAPANV